MPHLVRGVMRDTRRILTHNKWRKKFRENKTDACFSLGTSVIEFFPADDEAKLRGARRDILFINECNTVDFESFQQLDVRTRKHTLLDFNPVRRFWVHDNLIPSLPESDYIFIKSTYSDNAFLSAEEKRNIERRRQNANWWKVYGEGEIGSAEGLVFQQWEIVPAQPSVLKTDLTNIQFTSYLPGNIIGYGVDFGYTHSPTAIVQVNEFNGELYVHEWFYKTGVQNEELLNFVTLNIDVRKLAVGDSASPQNIDYLMRQGWFGLRPARKGEGSVEFGINLLLERKINVTQESLNLIKEFGEYMWETDINGHSARRPVKEYDHAIDAIRYLITYPPKQKLLIASG
jgi:phage terminase large subunit